MKFNPLLLSFFYAWPIHFRQSHAWSSSTDDWSSVVSSQPYQSLPAQAQTCLLNVNTFTNCRTFGCVCSEEDTRGTNFLASYNNISTCVQQAYNDNFVTNQACNAFKNICAVAAALVTSQTSAPSLSTANNVGTSTGQSTVTVTATESSSYTTASATIAAESTSLPIPSCRYLFLPSLEVKLMLVLGGAGLTLLKPDSYNNLTSCSKYAVNGCRNGYGTMDESSCGPLNNAPGWDSYMGIARKLGCCNALCLCEGPFFYVTLTAIYNQSVTYCNYLPSLNGSVDAGWDAVVGVVADWCANQDFPPGNFQYSYEGNKNSTGGLAQHEFRTLR
jgi:hypothetical protein